MNEQNFLLKHYKVDATGWGTPFLLVPEATTTDKVTLERLCAARREDLYLSDVSPLGVPFNSLRTSSSEVARDERIREGLFGNTCSKGYLRSNTEFTDQPLCVASRSYQEKKLAQILGTNGGSAALRNTIKENLAQKICLCRDLAGANLLQDVAAIRMLNELGQHYLDKFGYKMGLTAKFDEWMSAFPHDETAAYGVIVLGAATAALGGAQQVIVKSPQEAVGIPTKEANAGGIKATKQAIGLLSNQTYPLDSPRLQEEIETIRKETCSIDRRARREHRGLEAQPGRHVRPCSGVFPRHGPPRQRP